VALPWFRAICQSLTGGRLPSTLHIRVTGVTRWREVEIGSMAGRERQATTACPIPSQTIISHAQLRRQD